MRAEYPAWVIVGVDQPDGVMLLASTELNEAELSREYDRSHDDWPSDRQWISFEQPRHKLTVEMRQFVIITAPTYEEAFRHLFSQWTPQRKPQPQMTADRGTLPRLGP